MTAVQVLINADSTKKMSVLLVMETLTFNKIDYKLRTHFGEDTKCVGIYTLFGLTTSKIFQRKRNSTVQQIAYQIHNILQRL